jgi:hypothetical protein
MQKKPQMSEFHYSPNGVHLSFVSDIDASMSLENVCHEEFVACLDARIKIG